jgi:mercuric reductase
MKADVISVERVGHQKRVTYRVDGQIQTVEADEILLAAGKTPNTENLGLEHVSVKVDSRHAIIVTPSLQTSAPHVYAVGDVAALPARLEMTAGHEGTLASENALTGSQKAIDYDTVPYTVFTDPQLAGVGLTEDEQMDRLGACSCRTVSFEDVPKARILKRTEGLVKMAIHPETTQIMGVHMLAPHAGDLIAQAMMIVRNHNTIGDVLESLPMFPTLSESVKLVAMAFTRDISKVSCCLTNRCQARWSICSMPLCNSRRNHRRMRSCLRKAARVCTSEAATGLRPASVCVEFFAGRFIQATACILRFAAVKRCLIG